jgi:hypothetical protein
MEFTRICATCGEEFTARGNRATYCKKCAKARQKLSWQKQAAKRKECKFSDMDGQSLPENFFCDTPENIEICLNCTRDICLLDKNQRCPDLIKTRC